MSSFKLVLVLVCSAALLAGCTESSDAQRDQAAELKSAANDAQAIRTANARWLQLISNKDAAGIGQLYAEDGVALPQNEKAAVGREAIGQWWARQMQTPGYDLTFGTDQLVFSTSGDMALDRGWYRFSAQSPKGSINDTGKYVVVWRKIDGEWKVAADIFNTDLPAAS
ncbi:MAG: DUF4440 domain-containing protein [Sphingomicrobium sp.]